MPTPRYGLCSAVVDGKIYAIGGGQRRMMMITPLDVVERYDPRTDTWDTDVAPMNSSRYNAAAAAVNGKIYVIGGRGEHGEILDSVEEYDPQTDAWAERSPMPTLREGLALAVLHGNIYALGGSGQMGMPLATVERYDPATDRWDTDVPSMVTPRISLAAAVLDSAIYAIGGFFYGPVVSVERYQPGIGWSEVEDMIAPRGYCGAAAVKDSIFAIGGSNQNGQLNSVEAYSPFGDGGWDTIEPMNFAREGLTSSTVDDKIYAIGGIARMHHQMLEILDIVEEYTAAVTSVVEIPPVMPRDFLLYQNYPNPFNPSTTIRYAIPSAEHRAKSRGKGVDSKLSALRTTLRIYNLLGQEVKILVDEPKEAGYYSVSWDGKDSTGRDVASGVYFVQLRSGPLSLTRKAILLR
ncbi:MAG: kelch repeat-containing protein [bacterium]